MKEEMYDFILNLGTELQLKLEEPLKKSLNNLFEHP